MIPLYAPGSHDDPCGTRFSSTPGPPARSAALGDSLPLSPYAVLMSVPRDRLPHAAGIPSSATFFMPRYAVSPGYFYTLGIPLLRGRTFTDHDDEHSSRVVAVNESLASRLWPGEDLVRTEARQTLGIRLVS